MARRGEEALVWEAMQLRRRVSSRRVKRPYFFEILVAANLAALALLAALGVMPLLPSPVGTAVGLLLTVAIQAAVGVLIRAAVAAVRRERGYFRVVRRRRWLLDTLRLVIGAALVIFVYGWIKLMVPVVHPALFDEALWDLDRLLCFGISPTVLALDLFSRPAVLRAVDWSYANIFAASIVIASGYFLSDPSRRIRVAFANGYGLLWIAGAWLYILVPSLGPAYRFPDIWMAHGESLRITQNFQSLLMRNYQNVLRAARGEPHGPISIVYGIGAFPSLHVAFQTYVFLWMRRLWTSGEVLFGVFVIVIFLGSMITGWHYLIDGIAGLLLALACYLVFARRARVRRWLGLRRR
jgi:PAP2 superfamily